MYSYICIQDFFDCERHRIQLCNKKPTNKQEASK